jgi:hypothetical protein
MKARRPRASTPTLTVLPLLAALLLALPGLPAASVTARDLAAGAQAAMPESLTAEDWSAIGALMAEARYQFTWQIRDGHWAYRAPNQAQDLSLAISPEGLNAARYADGGDLLWDLGLSLLTYGDGSLPPAIDTNDLDADRARVEFRWSERLTEWYENGAQGIRHGFDLHAPPERGPTAVLFTLDGSLTPELDASGQVLRLLNGQDATALLHDQVTVHDASGRQLPVSLSLEPKGESLGGTDRGSSAMRPTTVRPALLRLGIDDSDALYPLSVTALIHSEASLPVDESAIVRAPDAQTGDSLGDSVAISGDTVVVGAPDEDGGTASPFADAGAAYIFERDQGGAGNWGFVAILRASDPQQEDNFGASVAIDSDLVVVGAPHEDGGTGDPAAESGAAYLFGRDQDGEDQWGQVRVLRASDAQGGDNLGSSVAISGGTIAAGAPYEDGGTGDPRADTGAVYLYVRDHGGADNWGQAAILHGSDDPTYWFGQSVAIGGDTLVAGATDAVAGMAYLFYRDQGGAGGWGQATVLRASDAQADDLFGVAVAISGDMVVIGAPGEDGGAGDPIPDSGAAYVFGRDQGGLNLWGEAAILRASDAQPGDRFGSSVAIDGDTTIAGAYNEGGGAGDPVPNSGAAYLFGRNQGGADNWGELTLLHAADAQQSDHFGWSVAISGDTIVVGAPDEDGGAGDPVVGAGTAYLFGIEPSSLRASDAQANDLFGWSVALDGDTLVVGAPNEDGGPGDPLDSSGAAYLFERDQGGPGHWNQATVLRASDAQADDLFGRSVAFSGDTIVVGAPGEDGGAGDPHQEAGAAYVFDRDQGGPGNWGQAVVLHASDGETEDWFGTSVAVSGDTVLVGAYGEDGGPGNPHPECGAAYIFEREHGGPDNWGQTAILRASDAQAEDFFGWSVAIDGDTAVVGAHGEDGGAGDPRPDSGAAYVFERHQGGTGNWGQTKVLRASDAQVDGLFGSSVAIGGDVIVAGGPGDPITSSGAAYVFDRHQGGAGNWGQTKILRASDAQAGDYFGTQVAISGDTVVVGASREDGGAGDPRTDSGAVYLFVRDEGSDDAWGQIAILRAYDAQGYDYFGASVATDGDTVVVGAPWENGGTGDPHSNAGAAYAFVLTKGELRVSGDQAYDRFGASVDISGDTLLVGVPDEDGGVNHSGTNAGAAYILGRDHGGEGTWGQVTILRASDAQAEDAFGRSVAISGDTVVVGAPRQDRGSPDASLDYGVAYVFERDEGGPDNWGQQAQLFASDAQVEDVFGWAVDIDGDTAVVGAYGEDGGAGDPQSMAGTGYVYERDQGGVGSWGEVAVLRASYAEAGDLFGWSVGIDGDSLVVSAIGVDGGGGLHPGVGAAYVFERDHGGADNWGQTRRLYASDGQALDYYGTSVAISGDTIVVGNANEDGGLGDPHPGSGAAYVYDRDEGGADNWGQTAILRASDAQAYDYFGVSVTVDGDTILAGASYEDGGAGDPRTDSGAAYLFGRDEGGAGNWGQEAILYAFDAQSGDHFGASVAISGDTVVAGAPNEGGGDFTPLPHTGTAYIFDLGPPPPPPPPSHMLYLPLVLRDA